ncbi:prostatic acid phosphatase-like [Daktulosphaira vitifoliae]|uniref:prostatic acid phosphatase-like n=1 Tax=Daktulosphaira vitifoliae TaxID=58002 RepID=UPI0021A9E0C0|nr:prostatic acid phosphatase-like [Daktulosphaira vitifoliae]
MICSLFIKFWAIFLLTFNFHAVAEYNNTTKTLHHNKHYRFNSLRLIHAIFRHGERTPADTYPTDPYVNYKWEPYGWGQLTNIGKRNQYEIGRFIRKRYSGFLDLLYSPDKVTFWSTDVDRTKMSAQLVAAALYKPIGNQKWNKHLEWQPIPIHTEKLNNDQLLLVRKSCPRYYEERQAIMNLSSIQRELLSYQNIYDYLTENTGMKVQDPDDVQSIYSTLKAESDYGLELPPWTSKVYPSQLAQITSRSFILNAFNDQMKKIKGGPLLKKILEDSKTKMINNSINQLYVYAGHDSTLSNLLIALGVWEEQIPTYNMLALLELHETSKGKFYFKVLLRNNTQMKPYKLSILGCKGSGCTFKYVESITKHVIPVDLDEECKCTTQHCLNLKIKEAGP